MDDPETVIPKFGITEYEFRKSRSAFLRHGTAGLVGTDSEKILEDFPREAERMVFVIKNARPWIPATKMTTLLKGFNHDFPLRLVRHLYASYGWALGTKPWTNIDFGSLNLKTVTLARLREAPTERKKFFRKKTNCKRCSKFLDLCKGVHQYSEHISSGQQAFSQL